MVLVKEPAPVSLEVSRGLRIGSLGTPEDVLEAVEIVSSGGVVAAQMRGVYGVWFNAADEGAVRTVTHIKYGEARGDRKFSAMMFSDQFVPLIDTEAITDNLRLLFCDPAAAQNRFGSMCHIRAPIRAEVAERLPQSLVSKKGERHYLQNLDPSGHRPIANLIQAFNEEGVEYVGVSSLNRDEKEITTRMRAEALSRDAGLPLLLTNPTPTRADILGSFVILVLEHTGNVSVDRDGHIPVDVIQLLLPEILLNRHSRTKPHGFPHADFSWLMETELTPEEVRTRVLLYVEGLSMSE